MKKVLLTGANGFIGRQLLKELLSHNISTVAIVRSSQAKYDLKSCFPDIDIICCDLSQAYLLPVLIKDRDIDTCIHLAWNGSCGIFQEDYPTQAHNIENGLTLIDALSEMNIPRLLCAGSIAELNALNYHFTDCTELPLKECYAICKLAFHSLSRVRCNLHHIEHIWCYIGNTYGMYDTTDNFINHTCRLFLSRQHGQFTAGTQLCDFVYITDVVKGLYFAALNGNANTSYYIGSTEPRPLKEYILTIRDQIDPDLDPGLGINKFYGISLTAEQLSCEKLIKDTGYHPSITFKEGIIRTIQWLKSLPTSCS